jgi:hypothetical protein
MGLNFSVKENKHTNIKFQSHPLNIYAIELRRFELKIQKKTKKILFLEIA